MINCLKNKIILTVIVGLILSISLNFYFINKYNLKDNSVYEKYEHRMLKSDPEKFWNQAHNTNIEISNGKNFFETGYEYRIAYLPSKLIYIYSNIFNDPLYHYQNEIHKGTLDDFTNEIDKIEINSDNKKVIFLIFQSIIYFLSVFFLSTKIKKLFNEKYSFYLVFFLCFEPNILLFHSSFWSESVFLSILIFCIAFIIDKDLDFKKNLVLGILLGLLFLQRSVAIYYCFIVIIFYLFFIQKEKYKKILFILAGYTIIIIFLGAHNYNRSSVFQIKPTQAMDGFYTYMIPSILIKTTSKTPGEIYNQLEFEKKEWVKKNNINFSQESDRIKYYKYLEKRSFNIIEKNLIESIKYTIDKTFHYLVFDPFRHVYYFYKYNLDDQNNFTKTNDHKKNILFRIIYSLTLYSLATIGLYKMYKEKKNNGLIFFMILSIIYFIAVSSWTGNNRYNVPNLIFMSFFVGNGIFFLRNKFFSKKL